MIWLSSFQIYWVMIIICICLIWYQIKFIFIWFISIWRIKTIIYYYTWLIVFFICYIIGGLEILILHYPMGFRRRSAKFLIFRFLICNFIMILFSYLDTLQIVMVYSLFLTLTKTFFLALWVFQLLLKKLLELY